MKGGHVIDIKELHEKMTACMSYIREAKFETIFSDDGDDYVYVEDGCIFFTWLKEFIETGNIVEIEQAKKEWKEDFGE